MVLAVFWIPGGVVLSTLHVRGLALVAVAPAATIALFSVGALGARALDVRWNLLAALATTALSAGVLVVVRRLRARWVSTTPTAVPARGTGPVPRASLASVWRASGAVGIAIAVSVVVQLAPVWQTFLTGDQIANLTDPLFHLNVLEYVRQTGVVTPDVLAHLADVTGRTALYPAGWHAVAGVVPVLLSAPSLLAAAQFLPVALAATAGIAALARAALRGRERVAVMAALLTACGVTLPLGLAIQPAVIPNALAVALVPGALALLVGRNEVPITSRASSFWPALALVTFGIAMCHPNAVVALALLALPWVARLAWRVWQRSTTLRRSAGAAAIAVSLAGVGWLVATNDTVALVGAIGVQPPQSLGSALSGLALGRIGESVTYAIVPTALAALGAVRRIRVKTGRGALVSWAIMITCFLAAATAWAGLAPLTGLFYNESRRLAPLVGIWSVVLAADGLEWVSRGLVARVRVPDRLGQRGGIALVAGVLIASSAFATFRAHEFLVSRIYNQTLYTPIPDNALVPFFTPAELNMAQRLPAELGSDARVLGSSFSGSSHLYGLEGIDVLPFYGLTVDEDLAYAADHIVELGNDPRVCAGLRAHGVTHLYVDPYLMRGDSWPKFAVPFDKLPSTGLRLVDSGGAATVYEITGCSA